MDGTCRRTVPGEEKMLTRLKDIIVSNRTLIILTFEVFWIVVFLLNRIANEASNIPEFVYVNF